MTKLLPFALFIAGSTALADHSLKCDDNSLAPPTISDWARSVSQVITETPQPSAQSASVGVTNLCENEEKRQMPCRNAADKVAEELALAKARGEKVLFIYGSERCGPCLAWKKALAGESLAGIRIVYLPLTFGRPSRDDLAVKKTCLGSIQTYQVHSQRLPRAIASIEACLRKPTLFMIDPSAGKGAEVDPGWVQKGAVSLSERLKNFASDL